MSIIDHIKNKVLKVKQKDNKQEEILKNKDENPSIFFPDKPFEECVKEANEDVEAKKIFKEVVKQVKKFSKIKESLDGSNSISIARKMAEYKCKMENLINSLIEKNPNILFLVEDEHKQNLGMMVAEIGLEDIVLKILDNPYLSCMQDDIGSNIGMISARSQLKKAVSKALDNPNASTQQDNFGWNIGMRCAEFPSLYEATLKALDNKKACVQQDRDGINMGMIAVVTQREKAVYEKVLENTEANLQQDKDGDNIGIRIVNHIGFNLRTTYYEDILLKILDNEFACMQQNANGNNVGMIIAEEGYKKATLKALDNLVASNQQNDEGFNIGMIAAKTFRDDEIDFKSLSNPVASIQQDKMGHNIGMFIADSFDINNTNDGVCNFRDPEILMKVLENKEACLQQDDDGTNIGMILSYNKNVPDFVVSAALKNKEVSLQQDNDGWNMGMFLIYNTRSKDLILEAMENEEALKQKNGNNETMFSLCDQECRYDVFLEIFKRGWYEKEIFKECLIKTEKDESDSCRVGEIDNLVYSAEVCAKKFDIDLGLDEAKEIIQIEESEMEE